MEKRGQVTTFIILGVVLIIILAGVFFLINSLISEKFKLQREKIILIPPQLKPVADFIDSCIKSTSLDGIDLISLQGGYIKPLNSLFYVNTEVPYYILDRKNIMPSKHFIENELAKDVNENLDFCLQDYKKFNEEGLIIEDKDFITEIKIQKDEVLVNLNYPITISKGNITVTLNEFTNKVDSRLDKIYDISKEVVDVHLENPNNLCLSCINKLSVENDVLIDVNKYNDETFVFTITDTLNLINNKPYKFRFAFSLT